MKLWRQLLLNGSVKLFWRNDILDEFISNISREGFDTYTFDCSKWNKTNYHIDLANTLKFPDYYGNNLNAFDDCLSDMVPKEIGIVLVFKNYDLFTKKEPEVAYHILMILFKSTRGDFYLKMLSYLPLFNQMMQPLISQI